MLLVFEGSYSQVISLPLPLSFLADSLLFSRAHLLSPTSSVIGRRNGQVSVIMNAPPYL